MDTKTILFSFVVVFLFAVFEGTEAASSSKYSIAVPLNRKMLGQPSKKCVVYTWTGVCQDQNCTDRIEYTLTKAIASVLANTAAFRPYTDGVKQGVCFYDKDEVASCCNSLMAGPATKNPQQLLVSIKDYDKIDFKITRELYNMKISVSDTFMLPWSDACQVSKPCSTYGTCVATKPNEYNCTCNAGWEGRNCSDVNAVSVSVSVPGYRKLLSAALPKKCIVYMWLGVCKAENCTEEIKYTLIRGSGSIALSKLPIKPLADREQQGFCFYGTGENASCCDTILNGTAAHNSQMVGFKDYEKIRVDVYRKVSYSTTSFWNTFLLPWRDACQVSKPCGTYGTCVPTKPDEYNCICNVGWEGRNCSDYTGWVTMYDKCLKDATNVKKLAPTSVDGCASQCKILNVVGKIGCKSFEFIPASAGSKLGECRLFDVSNKHDKKELKTCSGGIYFDMIKLPDANSGGLVSVSLLAISINVAVAMLM